MSVALRVLVVLTLMTAASCAEPATEGPGSMPVESVAEGEPTPPVTERPPRERATLPEPTQPVVEPTSPEQPTPPDVQTVPDPTSMETAQQAAPVLIYECATPALTVYDDMLGPGFLFDLRAMVSFSGPTATVTVTIDGFAAQEVNLTQDVSVPGLLEPVDLTRAFFDTRTDEDHYNGVSGTTRHHVVAVLTDDAGQSVTSECTFDVSYP